MKKLYFNKKLKNSQKINIRTNKNEVHDHEKIWDDKKCHVLGI